MAPLSAAPAFHSTLTSLLTPSDFSRRSTVCVRPLPESREVHPRVAFCGERAGRLWAAGRTAEAVQLEQLCGELAQDVDILCAYPVPYANDDQALTRICAEHTAVSTGWLEREVRVTEDEPAVIAVAADATDRTRGGGAPIAVCGDRRVLR